MLEVQNALEAKMDKIQAERMAVAIKENAGELFRPAASPVVGNVKGDVPVIEFFDYNCGYCKKAFTDVAQLMDKDKKVRVILKEFPILAKGSEEASRVALAAKMQGKYWEFHRAMLESQGQANEAAALRVAEKLGLDMARLKKDMASPEVKKEIDDTRQLATKMGIQGTPHFIVGDRIIPGAPENLAELLGKHVDDVRKDGLQGLLEAMRLTATTATARNASAQLAGPPFRGCGKAGKRGASVEDVRGTVALPSTASQQLQAAADAQADLRAQRAEPQSPGCSRAVDLWRGDAGRRPAAHRDARQALGPRAWTSVNRTWRASSSTGSRRRARRPAASSSTPAPTPTPRSPSSMRSMPPRSR